MQGRGHAASHETVGAVGAEHPSRPAVVSAVEIHHAVGFARHVDHAFATERDARSSAAASSAPSNRRGTHGKLGVRRIRVARSTRARRDACSKRHVRRSRTPEARDVDGIPHEVQRAAGDATAARLLARVTAVEQRDPGARARQAPGGAATGRARADNRDIETTHRCHVTLEFPRCRTRSSLPCFPIPPPQPPQRVNSTPPASRANEISIISRNHDEESSFAADVGAHAGHARSKIRRAAARLGELSGHLSPRSPSCCPGSDPSSPRGRWPPDSARPQATPRAVWRRRSEGRASPPNARDALQSAIEAGAILLGVHTVESRVAAIRACPPDRRRDESRNRELD